MSNIQEVRGQVATARTQLEEAKKQAEKTKFDLLQQKSKLPDIRGQEALRSKFAGLVGRSQRRNVLGVEGEIGSAVGQVEEYKEKTIKPFQGQVEQAEGQIADYDARMAAIRRVERVAAQGNLWILLAYGKGYDYQYAKEYQRNLQFQREAFAKQVDKIQGSLPKGETLIVDWKNLKVQGVDSKALQQSLPVIDGKIRFGVPSPSVSAPSLSVSQLGGISTMSTSVPVSNISKMDAIKSSPMFAISTALTPKWLPSLISPKYKSMPEGKERMLEEARYLGSSPVITALEFTKRVGQPVAGTLLTPFTAPTGDIGYTQTLESAGRNPLQFFTKAGTIYKERKEIERGLPEYNIGISKINQLVSKQEELSKQLDEGKIQFQDYERKFQETQSQISQIQSSPFFKKVEEKGGITTIPTLISEKPASDLQKRGATFFLSGARTLSYFTPARFVYGVEALGGGVESVQAGQLGKGALQLGTGALLVTPFGKLGKGATAETGKQASKLVTGLKVGGGTVLLGGISTAQGFSTFKQTGDVGMGIASGAGTLFGGILGVSSIALGRDKVYVGRKTFEQQREILAPKLAKVQKELAKDQAEISKIQSERFKLLRGESGMRADEFGRLTGQELPRTALVSPISISAGQKLTATQKDALVKYYLNTGVAKTKEQAIKLVQDSRVGSVQIDTRLPSEVTLFGGSRGDIARTVKLPELSASPFIGKGQSKFGIISTGIKSDAGTKEVAFIGSITKSGRISKQGEIQIITGTKGDKFAVITPFESAKRFREVKIGGQPNIQISEVGFMKGKPTIVKFDKSQTQRIGESQISVRTTDAQFREVAPFGRRQFVQPTELSKEASRTISVKGTRKLFAKSTPTSKEKITDVIVTGKEKPFNLEVSAQVGDKSLGVGSKKVVTGTTESFLQFTGTKVKGISPIGFKIPKISEPKVSTTTSFTSGKPDSQLKQVLEVKTEAPKLVVLPRKVEIKTTDVSPSIVKPTTTSQSTPSIYAGVGMYEITTSQSFTKPEVRMGIQMKENIIQSQIGEIKLDVSPKVRTAQIQSPKLESIKITDLQSEPKIESSMKIKQAQKLSSKQLQMLKSVQKQETKLESILKTSTRKTVEPMPKQPFRGIGLSSALSRVKEKAKESPSFFEAFGRRRGKDISLGKFRGQEEAESKLGKFLTGTLGASGKIKADGQELEFSKLRFAKSPQFRIGKSESTRVVQKRTFRLGTSSEKSEIKRARGFFK